MELFGQYDVVVVGAGVTGVVAAIRSARQGARTLLLEDSGVLGGLVTGGRLTKPQGLVNGGVFAELFDRCAGYNGADTTVRHADFGAYTSAFDSEVMQRVIIEVIEEANVEVLLRAKVVGVLRDGENLLGLEIYTKSGRKLVLAKVVIDSSGDGDVAALSGAEFMIGRKEDGLTQPISSYFRVLNVDVPALVADCKAHPEDMVHVILPDNAGTRNEDFIMSVLICGFAERLRKAREQGFKWIIPRNNLILKTGLIPGEINLNVTRVHGNALDDRVLSRAEIEVRKQAYCALDFLKRYVKGFENAIFLDIAAKLGVRETRRIKGKYVLTGAEVRGQTRFEDAIGLCNSPIDIHDPAGDKLVVNNIGSGYGIPYRCLLPEKIKNLLVAGRCISVDEIALSSSRNIPGCAITGEAAGIAAALCSMRGITPSALPVGDVQTILRKQGVILGTPGDDFPDVLVRLPSDANAKPLMV